MVARAVGDSRAVSDHAFNRGLTHPRYLALVKVS